MSETTELSVIEIKPEQAPALYIPNGLESYFEHIKASVSEAPDLSTKKGRDRVASLAAQVSRSKTAVEKPGREYLKRLKEAVRPAEQEIKRFVDACDALRDETRRPLTEWEAEQERIAAEKAAEEERLRIEAEQAAAAEALKKQIEDGHELALLMNIQFDRDAADAQAEAERQRIAHEEEIKRQAAEQARIDAEENIKREREESAQREAALKLKAEQEEQAKIEVQQAAEREKKEAAEKVERDKKEAQERAEREKQEAIAEEQRKQQEAEQHRVAEEKRLKDEADKRAADVAHRKTIGTAVVNALTEHAGLTREQAIETLKALMDNKIPHTSIQY
ncbi:hypothetical protein [Rouxiella badensis]|uniref:hypothetical protein n=1 Tax=Rouxiella badensis TaxID=1646377 RepID=UPI0022AB4165|nr:hypothetical protein [Rouxiella badensis]WAT10103.1 hypothetical protein O1V65_05950 [Rouxiella badensis]